MRKQSPVIPSEVEGSRGFAVQRRLPRAILAAPRDLSASLEMTRVAVVLFARWVFLGT